MHPRKKLLAKLALLLGGFLFALLAAEVGLRLLGVSYPLPYHPDPNVGSRLEPGFAAWFTKEGRAWVRINSEGFRDREHERAKPANVTRIAVLGDSFAEAVQVPMEQTFWSVMENELNQQFPERRFEVLNFGISGHGTGQQLEMYRHYARAYQPDIVLLAFFAANDVRNNSRALESDLVRPFFDLDASGNLVLDNSFRNHPSFQKALSKSVRFKVRLINHSRILQVINEFRNRRQLADRNGEEPNGEEPGIEHDELRNPTNADWINAWQLTEHLIVELDKEVQPAAEFAVVMVPSGIEVHPNPDARNAYIVTNDLEDLDYPTERIAKLGRSEGFLTIPLTYPMRTFAEDTGEFLHGFPNTKPATGHWNRQGHRLAGEMIAKELAKLVETDPLAVSVSSPLCPR